MPTASITAPAVPPIHRYENALSYMANGVKDPSTVSLHGFAASVHVVRQGFTRPDLSSQWRERATETSREAFWSSSWSLESRLLANVPEVGVRILQDAADGRRHADLPTDKLLRYALTGAAKAISEGSDAGAIIPHVLKITSDPDPQGLGASFWGRLPRRRAMELATEYRVPAGRILKREPRAIGLPNFTAPSSPTMFDRALPGYKFAGDDTLIDRVSFDAATVTAATRLMARISRSDSPTRKLAAFGRVLDAEINGQRTPRNTILKFMIDAERSLNSSTTHDATRRNIESRLGRAVVTSTLADIRVVSRIAARPEVAPHAIRNLAKHPEASCSERTAFYLVRALTSAYEKVSPDERRELADLAYAASANRPQMKHAMRRFWATPVVQADSLRLIAAGKTDVLDAVESARPRLTWQWVNLADADRRLAAPALVASNHIRENDPLTTTRLAKSVFLGQSVVPGRALVAIEHLAKRHSSSLNLTEGQREGWSAVGRVTGNLLQARSGGDVVWGDVDRDIRQVSAIDPNLGSAMHAACAAEEAPLSQSGRLTRSSGTIPH